MKEPRHLLVEVIAERTLEVKDTKKLVKEIAAYLLLENRVDELDSILRDVIEYRAEKGLVEVGVVSAHDLTDAVRKDVVDLLKDEYKLAKNITVSERVDPLLVGGIRVVTPHEQLDMTVRSKLSDFKRLTLTGKE